MSINFPGQRAADHLIRGEGLVAWFYLDSNGVVTVAYGRAVETADEAVELNKGPLPFSIHHGCASNDTVRKEWQKIADMAEKYKGYKASFFQQHSSVRCEQRDAINLLMEDIRERVEKVLPWFGDFNGLPDGVKIAIADLAYNTGAHNFGAPGRWENFTKAINAGDWEKAAKESHRAPPISEARNQETEKLILEHLGD